MTFELLPVHGLADDELTEMANRFAEKCQKAAQQTVKDAITAGNALNEIQSRVGHGKWRNWLAENFDYSPRTALTYQTLAANVKRFTFEPTSIRKAMEIIAREEAVEAGQTEPPVTPRAKRVTGRVEVSQPVEPVSDADELDENAVPAEPKTNTLHRPATRKAEEADRPVPAPVTPEIVDDIPADIPGYDWSVLIRKDDAMAVVAACRDVLASHWMLLLLPVLEHVPVGDKRAAKVIRDAAERVDPSKESKTKTPSRAELVAMIPDDWAPELKKAAADWAEYKQARAKGERIQTIRAWELALEKFTSQPLKTVISKVNKAIENSWKGWDHDSGKTASAKPEPRKRDMSTYYQ